MKSKEPFPRKTAVTLHYNETMDAPVVTAKGKGKIAETIIEKAAENQVPVHEDPSLAELLGQINLNQSIPEELFQAVAEVFAFIYQADKKAGERTNPAQKEARKTPENLRYTRRNDS